MSNPYIRLYNGKKFHLLDPKQSEFDIENIARSLSKLCRFTGHTRKFLSIAQHCCTVCDLLPDSLKKEGLLHDAAESSLADINSPLKSILPQYKEIETRAEKALAKKFKLQFPFPPMVKEADMIALVTEMKNFMPGADYKVYPYKPMSGKMKAWSMEKSYNEFMKRYKKLYK